VRAVLDGEFPIHAPFRYVQGVPNSTMTHVSASPPFHPVVNIYIVRITLMEEKNIIDCLSKSCIFTEVDVLLTTGRTIEFYLNRK